MRHQRAQIHHPALDQPDGTRPRIAVAVLELQVDFLGTEAHKGEGHVGLADADDEDLAAETDAVDRGRDGGFDAGALEGDGGADVPRCAGDRGGGVLGRDGPFDFVGAHAGDECLGEGEAGGVDVGDDDGFGAGGGGAEEGDQADGAGAADEDRVPEADVGALGAGQGHGEGFQQRAVLEGHASDLVAPLRWVVDVAAEQAVHGGGG